MSFFQMGSFGKFWEITASLRLGCASAEVALSISSGALRFCRDESAARSDPTRLACRKQGF
jgi:hypothetical protein